MKKILHITTDNKFISHALSTFESVYPNQNTVWMLDDMGEINLGNNKSDYKFSLKETFSFAFLKKLKNFDLIVLHSFTFPWYLLIILAPKNIKIAWLGWGFDYYEYIYKDSSRLLLNDTLNLSEKLISKKEKINIKFLVKKMIKFLVIKIIKPRALKRINSFSPVLEEDYNLVARSNIIPYLPKFMPWNYGSLEQNLIKNFIGHRVHGESILIGNSASLTNNHLDIISFLSDFDFNENTEIITPLCYGNEEYKNEIIKVGNADLGDVFHPVTDFMPIDDYVALIKQCGYVIMNHKRQQAVGNIIIMLYLGARVFLREECPTYLMLKKEGAILNTVQELEVDHKLLRKPLTEKEIQNNIKILYKHWSKDAIDTKTKKLVDFHLGNSNAS